jgi:hypothetical protein
MADFHLAKQAFLYREKAVMLSWPGEVDTGGAP